MKYRSSSINVLLVLLTVTSAVGVVALSPEVPVVVRLFAVAGVVAVFITLSLFAHWALTKDRSRMAMFAAVRGWEFYAKAEDLASRFSVFPFGTGYGGSALNVLTGVHRFHTCTTFTYMILRPAPQMYQITMVEIGANVPRFELLPEDVVASVAKIAGGQDIIVGNPAFDDHWRIVSEYEGFVRDVLNPELQRRLCRRATRGVPLAIDAGAVLTWRAGPASVLSLSRRLDVLIEVAEAIPDDWWKRSPRRLDDELA